MTPLVLSSISPSEKEDYPTTLRLPLPSLARPHRPPQKGIGSNSCNLNSQFCPTHQPARAVRPAGLAGLRETVERAGSDGWMEEERSGERERGESSKERHDDCPLSISRVGRGGGGGGGGGGQSLPLPSFPSLARSGVGRPLWAEKGYVSKPCRTPMISHLGFVIERMKMMH